MKQKKYVLIACMLGAVLALSGCGESFPEMTEEEYNQTVEFAVGLLLKYSNNDQSKLTYVNAKEEQKAREKAAREEAKKNQTSEQTKTPQSTQPKTPTTTTPTQTSEKDNEEKLVNDGSYTVSGTDSSENPENIDETIAEAGNETSSEEKEDAGSDTKEQQTDSSTTSNPNAMVMSSDESMEVMSDIYLSYQGYSISSTYPESSKSYVINADKGKRLLVLRFDVYNGSDSAKKVNFIEKNILIQVLLNGKNLGYTAVTFLPNDLTSYVGTIDSRAHESLVALTEIDESASTNIQTLGMKVSISGIERDVELK
ncbi:MAG: hypothetical protein IKO76_02010 [Butyrivibrio sp.]|nr:hypothetical protein [Butyrivibrio sp.]